MKEKIMLRSKAKTLEPIARIGKSGLSDSMIGEINKNLKKRKLIKIKLLKSPVDREEKEKLIDSIVEKTHSQLIDSVGNIIVLYREF
ncbi:MAG TPA: ribosome assembly RNA-binding protein YhbY [Candidatus Nanoarchaeia archaeon]|nr:ribosome assembly RNA-binding protein YhbY [Candidatus Nanoarchaeia archaeon]